LAKSLPNLMIEVTVLLSILVIFIYGSINGSEPKFWINLLAIYALAAFRIMPSVKRIMSYITRIRLFDYTIPQIEEIQNKIKKTENNPIEFNDRIQFNNVSFSHEKSMFKILDSIHFDLVKGSCMGIFGASGTGKTTFLHILMGLIPPKSGSVEIDGTTHTHPGGIFAYVRQDVFVLEGSLVQNIALGVPDEEIDYELIEYCLHWSSLKKWVSNLPEGIYRPLSESGKNMSGGEKQRMAIARALYAQAEILIFDEPIGSLDPDNAQQILDAISFLKESGKTIVIVSHQPEALVHCNQIFELNKGKLIPQ
jgi:ABC-type bacteriocin/lantibiotic exporter with double-glycine peptidase domain